MYQDRSKKRLSKKIGDFYKLLVVFMNQIFAL